MDVRVGLWRRLSAEELMLLNCVVKTLESPFDCKETQPVHSKGGPPWDFFGHLMPKYFSMSWLVGKDSDAGRDWGQEKKGMTKDEMAGWHHWLNGRQSEWTLGVGDGQGGLVCCNSWGRKESDMTEQVNWTELTEWYKYHYLLFLVLSAYIKYLFPFSHFQFMCVFSSEVSVLQALYSWILFFLIFVFFFGLPSGSDMLSYNCVLAFNW